MTKRQLKNRIKNLYQQLDLINLYPENFEENLGGKRAVLDKINEILDEMIEINLELEKLKNNDN